MTELQDGRSPLPAEEPAGIIATRDEPAPSHRRSGGTSRPGPSRRWMGGFFGILAVVLVLGAGLAYVGLSTVRTSRAGRVISTITDPAAPGFEALVEPSPTLLVLDRVGEKALGSVAVLTLNSGDQGGTVLLVPPDTRVTADKESVSVAAVNAFSPHPEDTRYTVQDVATLGIAEAATVDAERWTQLVEPVAPLTVDNPSAVPGFPAGPIQLEAEQVAPWLHARAPGETQIDQLRRQRLFWQAWIAAVSTSTVAAPVPGEIDSGMGRFVLGLAHGTARVEPIAVTPETHPDGSIGYISDLGSTRALVNELVPFPTGSAHQPRVRVRLLDGTGDQQHVGRVAPMLTAADAEVTVAGNADRFDYTTTEVRYHDPLVAEQAVALQKALGVGKVVEDPRPTEAFDVTIILGSDV